MKKLIIKVLTHVLALTAGLFIAVQLIEQPVYVYTDPYKISVRYHEPIDYNQWQLTFLRSLPHKA